MNYLDDIGCETKDREYKIFTFNPILISPEDAIKYLSNGKFIFNNSVIQTIKNYLNIYLPKYISSYCNPKSNLKEGVLYFGVSDDGIINGIPFLGNLKEDFINHQIDKIFQKSLKFSSENIKQEVKSGLTLELIKLKKPDLIEKNNMLYEKYLKELDVINNNHSKYKNKKRIWERLLDQNLSKLSDMINDNDTKKIIYEYIKEKSNGSQLIFKNKYSHLYGICDVPDYWDFITQIKTNHKFKILQPGKMPYIKNDNLNIYNWVAQWKDSKINMLKYAKPKSPKKKIDSNYPLFLLSQSNKMIPQWIKTNLKLNLYLIKITIKIKNHHLIDYKDIENRWKKSYRSIKNGQPVSVPYLE